MNFYFQQNKTFKHKFKGWTFLLVSEARSIHENSVSGPRAVGQFEKHGLSRRDLGSGEPNFPEWEWEWNFHSQVRKFFESFLRPGVEKPHECLRYGLLKCAPSLILQRKSNSKHFFNHGEHLLCSLM